MADDEGAVYGNGESTPPLRSFNGDYERRRERASRESNRDGERSRDRDRDRGNDRRHRDVDVDRERDRGVRDRVRDLDPERHRSHERERRTHEYGGDRDRTHRRRSRSSSRGPSGDVSKSRSRSRSRSRKTSGFDRAPSGTAVGSSAAIPGTERQFQVGSNRNNSGGFLPQQSCKGAVDDVVRGNLGGDAQQSEVHDGGSSGGEVQGCKSVTAPVVKLGKNSKWGPAPSSEDAMSTEVANDFQAAKMAAIRAAELVNKNMSLAGFMSTDHKKKLLWGSKKAQVEQEPVVVAAGTNRWDTVHFSDRDRMEKFHKLMGVKGDIKEGEAPPPPPGAGIFTEEKQRELQEDLEKQFTQGLRRRDGRTVGLGL